MGLFDELGMVFITAENLGPKVLVDIRMVIHGKHHCDTLFEISPI